MELLAKGKGRAASTRTRYRSAINANIKLGLEANWPWARLGPADLDDFHSQLVKAGLGTATPAKATSPDRIKSATC